MLEWVLCLKRIVKEGYLSVSDSTGAIDLAIHPSHPDTIYAALWERTRNPQMRHYGGLTSDIYRSYNGGQTWEKLSNRLPDNDFEKGRIGMQLRQLNPIFYMHIMPTRTAA